MSLNDKIKSAILEVQQEQEEVKLQTKKLRLPFKAKVGRKKQKLNWVGILKVNENGTIEPSKQQIKDQTIMVDGVPRLATSDCVLRWNTLRKTFPVIFLESWSVIPYSPNERVKASMLDGSNKKGYRILLDRMESEKVKDLNKKGLGWIKWVIGLVVLGVIVYAFASRSVF
jgi:hypothetical protein